MYARYIPPPKAKAQPIPEPPPASAEVIEPVAIAPATSTITPYARYVPPPKSKRSEVPTPAPQKIVFNYDEVADEPSSKKRKLHDSEQNATESGKKKSKKSKDKSGKGVSDGEPRPREKVTSSDEPASSTAVDLDHGEPEVPSPETEVKHSEKKKKKAKKIEVGDQDEDDTVATRSKQDKEEKKSKKSKPSEESESPPDEEQDVSPKQSKKKKKKRESEATADPATLNMEGPDEVTERHKAVLKKKEKSLKRLKRDAKDVDETQENQEQEASDVIMKEPTEVHGLEPLPQPEPIAQDTSGPAYETLPSWLATPIRVTPTAKASFGKLGIGSEAEKVLESKGYKEAFAVQTATIPMLMPSADRQGDLVVSAATGSGKTLAYVLPMVRDVSQGVVTRLRGLIVVPTRELVRQAQEVCEACATAFSGSGQKRVKIGISMGNQAFKAEQAALMHEEQRYEPDGYQRYLQQRQEADLFEELDAESNLHGSSKPLPDHVVDHVSKVDILICTPGRLVEHINLTPGFSLDYVRWLVVDEADKLLAQSFQQWLDIVMEKLSIEKPNARDFPDSNKSGVRKVILSATMTRDLSLLNGLKLRRPRLIVLEGTKSDEAVEREDKTVHVLPELLRESAIKVRDPSLKPLLLVDLLHSEHLKPIATGDASVNEDEEDIDDADDTSSSGSDSDETSSSESGSDSGSDFESSESSDDSSPKRKTTPQSRKAFQATVLIFTKSNETALRLSRLLSILSPDLSSLIGTLTSTTRTSQRRKTLGAFTNRKLRILIASDLVARGIDLTNLDHVVNYDIPTSVASYVHRVGRTARAGQSGHAWTFFTKTEAGWFWPEIAGQGKNPSKLGGIKRTQKVENIRFGGDEGGRFSEKRVEEYEAALEKLGQEAGELRRRR